MKWAQDAEEKISRVPFFVRKRVRKKVEEEAARRGASQVRLEHVLAAQQRYLSTMEDEVRGYQVERCFGESGCPNRAIPDNALSAQIEALLQSKDLKRFLKERVEGPLKMHHEFRVSISDCPNGCSRPQIVDLGLIGACLPRLSQTPCTQCGACVETCREEALRLAPEASEPTIDYARCVACGQCIKACPSGTLGQSRCGYRILVGGKLGRHPQLAKDLGRIYSPEEALRVVERCIEHYMKHNRKGERFGEILKRTGLADLEDPVRD
ncbi:MAG: 4Fe-4S dicluster domain-containing protein [Syntrophobacteraceae bacterium]